MEVRRQDEGYNNLTPIQDTKPFSSSPSLLTTGPGVRNGIGSATANPPPRRAPDPTLAATPLACATTVGSVPRSEIDTGVRYRECLRNHAAALGGNVLDGCGEFMPGGAPETIKCAACGCHRSFHRKDSDGDGEHNPFYYRFHNGAHHRPHLLLPPPPLHHHPHSGGTTTESSSEELNAGVATMAPLAKKRFRTKFTAGQKERMLEFAEGMGWRIQKQQETEMGRFCAEIGVSRQVFKVWMHNNKHNIRKPQHLEQQQQQHQQHHLQQQQQQQQQQQHQLQQQQEP